MEEHRKQAEKILTEMTLNEKIALISGKDYMWTAGVPRLGVRALHMADASMGLRHAHFTGIAYPAMVALAATWDVKTAAAYGDAVGAEFREAGFDVLLGPGINLYRSAMCGRNFEYFGEDPVLAGELAASYVRAAQSRGVSATLKHLVANNSDWHRNVSNSVIDERTLREVYLATFEKVVKEGEAGAIMTSYNLLNGEYTAEKRSLVRDIVQDEWQFEGVIMSDWGGTWNAEPAFNSGISLEMGEAKVFKPGKLLQLAEAGDLDMQELDRKVLTVLSWTLAIDAAQASAPSPAELPSRSQRRQTALEVARRGTVLLQNDDDLLPLADKNGLTISVVGPHAQPTPTSGGGAAKVDAVDPRSILGAVLEIAPGISLSRDPDKLADSDAVVVCVGFDDKLEGEALDRPFELPWKQEMLIRDCVAANPNTVVVLIAGGGVAMGNWIDNVKAVLHAWYPGEIGTLALAEILFGRCNPSGKLPISIERNPVDAPAYDNYLPPGANLYTEPDFGFRPIPVFPVSYKEGVFVGYRHYDRAGTEPLFPFGYGLSYTTFRYENLEIEQHEHGATVQCDITNTGDIAGDEIVQVYVGAPECSVERPVRELKGFSRISLSAGETGRVQFNLPRRAFAFYDVKTQSWRIEPGTFTIEIAASARDIRLSSDICLGS